MERLSILFFSNEGSKLLDLRLNSTSGDETDSNTRPKTGMPSEISLNSFPNIEFNERAIDVDQVTAPFDCSFKSKVLYESFRGKTNTLNRRRFNHLHLLHDATSSPSKFDNNDLKITSSLKITSTPIKKLTLAEINRSKSLDEPKQTPNIDKRFRNTKMIASKIKEKTPEKESSPTPSSSSSSSASVSISIDILSKTDITSVYNDKDILSKKYQKQMSINTDRDALCPVVDENLVK
jgi:hypothetical protein